jgi:predicted RNA methylase
VKIDDEVLGVLSRMTFTEKEGRIEDGQLDRKLYLKLAKLLKEMGGVWKGGKVSAHLFDRDPRDMVETTLLTGEICTSSEMGFFPTPVLVANKVVDIARPYLRPNARVLEPSAGEGNLALHCPVGVDLTLVEIDPRRTKTLREKFEGTAFTHRVLEMDFLEMKPEEHAPFDVIIMNPPFGKGQDVTHVLHALKFLAEGGRLVSIMASGVTFREDRRYKEFRALLDDRGASVSHNPERSFWLSGTNVNTITVTID